MHIPELRLDLQDDQWPLDYIDHDRQIARAIVVDDEGYFYFMRVERWDEFAEGALIETSGGGVEPGEDPHTAILRELKEELGVTAEVLGKIGVVSDYYNLIHRHNINHYFLCRAISFGEKNMTQEFVAESLGISRQAVSKWENGTSEPSTSNLIAIAKLYEVAPEELLKKLI